MSLLVLSPQTKKSLEREKLWKAREFFSKPGVLKRSLHGLRYGDEADYYFDIDYLLNDPDQCQTVLGIYFDMINDLRQRVSINFLAFIEKASGGTVGSVRLSAALSIKTSLPNIIVRLGKGIIFERVKAHHDQYNLKGFRAVIIADHCTSGREVILAAQALRKVNAVVENAIVYTIRKDKIEEDKLQAEGINLQYAFELPTYDRFEKNPSDMEAILINY